MFVTFTKQGLGLSSRRGASFLWLTIVDLVQSRFLFIWLFFTHVSTRVKIKIRSCLVYMRHATQMHCGNVFLWECGNLQPDLQEPPKPPPSLPLSHLQLIANSLQGKFFFLYSLLAQYINLAVVFKLKCFKYSLISEFSHSPNVLLSPSLPPKSTFKRSIYQISNKSFLSLSLFLSLSFSLTSSAAL